jgi:translocation and assembly module TamB
MKQTVKIISYFGSGLVILLLILFLLISSGALNPVITKILNTLSSQQLNGSLAIESIEGNLFHEFSLNNIQITENNYPLIAINSVEIKYDIWELKQKKISIDHLILNQTHLYLMQNKDSLWNIEKLISMNESPDEDSLPFTWGIEIGAIQIEEFEADIEPADTALSIPHNIKFNTMLYFSYVNNKVRLKMQQFDVKTQNPEFQVKNLNFSAELTDSILNWSDFELKLAHSNISSSGTLPLNKRSLAQLNITASPLDFNDFKPWLPNVYGNPEINIQLANTSGVSKIDFSLIQNEQKVKLKGTVKDYDSIPIYNFLLETDSLDLAYWTHNPEFKSSVKGKCDISGEGFDFKENSMTVLAQFDDVRYENYNLENFSLSFSKQKENLDAKLKTNTILGSLNSNIHISNLFQIPVYDANLTLRHFNLAKLTTDKKLESDLNISLTAKGRGYEPGKMHSSIVLQSNNSVLFNEPIHDMSARINITEQMYAIKGLVFKTSYLSAMIEGKGNFSEDNKLSFSLKSKNIEPVLSILGFTPIHFEGTIAGAISGPLNALNLDSDIDIKLLGADSLILTNTKANIKTKFSLDPNKQHNNNSNDILHLSEITLQNINMSTSAHIGTVAFSSYAMGNIDLEAYKKTETIKGNISSQGHFGSVETDFMMAQIFNLPHYSFNATLNNIDLAQLTGNDSLYSNLNLKIRAQGNGLNPDSLNIKLDLKSNESMIFGWPIEDFDSKIIYNKGHYRLEKLGIITPFLTARITGEGDITANNNLGFYLKTKDLEKINPTLRPGKLMFKGEIVGKLTGTVDSLNISSIINVEHFQIDTIRIEKILADASLKKRDSSYTGQIDLQLYDSKIQDLEFKKMQFTSKFTQEKSINFFSYYSSDSLQGKILTEVNFSQNPTIYFNEIALTFQNSLWEGGSNSTFMRFGKDSIEINDLNITSNGSAFKADGIFAFKGNEDLHIEIKDMDLLGLPGIHFFPYPVSGNLNGKINITGTANNPIIDAAINIINPVIDTFHLQKIATSYNYSNEKFILNASVDDNISRLLTANLEIPYQFSFTEAVKMPPKETPIIFNLILNEFDLHRINRLIPLNDARFNGYLTANLNLQNTISNPKVSGNLNIKKGDFSYRKLGIFYKNIELNSILNNNQLKIDSLSIFTAKGKLQLNGSVEIDSLFQGELKYVDLNMNGQNFKMFDSEIASAVINTNINLKGTPENPVFKGNLAMVRSSFNVDLFLKEFNKVYDNSEQPMLIVAKNSSMSLDITDKIQKDTLRKPAPNMYKNLKGQFDIEIPRNSWVKGKNMNFELAGSIKAIKVDDKIDVFGSLNVKRGYYKLYGRRVDFEEGKVTFTGGTSFNPEVNFILAYSFRDPENALRKLKVNITGRLMEPKLAFVIDDVPIEEKDAISYLIFNKGVNQLDTRENNAVINSNIDFAFGQLSNVVKDALQSKIGLDVIEIKGNKGWTQSTISTGKYITNNLFLNYEHTFAMDKKNKVIEPEKITLEYQFYRSLFLQATNQSSNSGFDFVLKWTWK